MKRNALTPSERETLFFSLLRQVLQGEITEGELVRVLRRRVLGVSQSKYAALVGVSRSVLSMMERNEGTVSTSIREAILRPLGLHTCPWPIRKDHQKALLSPFEKKSTL